MKIDFSDSFSRIFSFSFLLRSILFCSVRFVLSTSLLCFSLHSTHFSSYTRARAASTRNQNFPLPTAHDSLFLSSSDRRCLSTRHIESQRTGSVEGKCDMMRERPKQTKSENTRNSLCTLVQQRERKLTKMSRHRSCSERSYVLCFGGYFSVVSFLSENLVCESTVYIRGVYVEHSMN